MAQFSGKITLRVIIRFYAFLVFASENPILRTYVYLCIKWRKITRLWMLSSHYAHTKFDIWSNYYSLFPVWWFFVCWTFLLAVKSVSHYYHFFLIYYPYLITTNGFHYILLGTPMNMRFLLEFFIWNIFGIFIKWHGFFKRIIIAFW